MKLATLAFIALLQICLTRGVHGEPFRDGTSIFGWARGSRLNRNDQTIKKPLKSAIKPYDSSEIPRTTKKYDYFDADDWVFNRKMHAFSDRAVRTVRERLPTIEQPGIIPARQSAPKVRFAGADSVQEYDKHHDRDHVEYWAIENEPILAPAGPGAKNARKSFIDKPYTRPSTAAIQRASESPKVLTQSKEESRCGPGAKLVRNLRGFLTCSRYLQ